jgi:hypothetical protein
MDLGIVFAFSLLTCALGLITITNDVSFNALCSQRVNDLVRVEKLINVTYIYSLHNVNMDVWSQFPDMNVPFSLKYAQYVLISYRLLSWTTENSFFVTRVKIDGVENHHFRDISAGSVFHSNSASKQVFLGEGQHTVEVEYRSSGKTLNN